MEEYGVFGSANGLPTKKIEHLALSELWVSSRNVRLGDERQGGRAQAAGKKLESRKASKHPKRQSQEVVAKGDGLSRARLDSARLDSNSTQPQLSSFAGVGWQRVGDSDQTDCDE